MRSYTKVMCFREMQSPTGFFHSFRLLHQIPLNLRILIVIHVVGIARKGAFEPRVLGLCVVEYHVKHQPDAARLCCANEGVHVLHRAETRVDGTVVRDIVTIVVLR